MRILESGGLKAVVTTNQGTSLSINSKHGLQIVDVPSLILCSDNNLI